MTELPDRLLRDALRSTAPASNVCIDAEALAAWAEGTMSGAARAALEIHAADCERCQALVAAMVRTEPPPVEPAWWRRPLFSWVLPLAAATAAVIVVVSLSLNGRRTPAAETAQRQSTGAAAEKVARSEPPVSPAPAPAAPATAPPKPASKHEPVTTLAQTAGPRLEPKSAGGGLSTSKKMKTETRAQDADTAAALRPAPAPPPAAVAAARTDTRELAATRNLAGAAAPPPPPAPPPPVAQLPTAQPAAEPPAGVAAAAPAAASANALGGVAVSAESPRTFGAGRGGGEAQKMRRVSPVLIPSPAAESQWRIVDGGVERSVDGGVTWQAQALGVDVPVRAGAAPAARVCWLAGARGLVLLTTDGTHWGRIAFPDSVDLIAVEATDASHATVTTATGIRFRTGDGGATWIRQ